MSKIITSNKFYFLYCVLMYIVMAIILANAISIQFTMLLSESLAAVLLAYGVAKVITRFIAIRTYFTPVIFLVVQIVAMILGITFSHENSGVNFTMWTFGNAIILFLATQIVLKKLIVKRTLVS